MEFGLVLKMILTSVSGTSLKLMVMGYTFGPTETDMKASGTLAQSMVKEPTLSPLLEKPTQVNTKMANHMVKAPTLGRMGNSTKVTSKKD